MDLAVAVNTVRAPLGALDASLDRRTQESAYSTGHAGVRVLIVVSLVLAVENARL